MGEKTPLRSTLVAGEKDQSGLTISHFRLGKEGLHTISIPTQGTVSQDWWVLGNNPWRKHNANTGRVNWEFQDLENDKMGSSSIFVTNKASLVYIADFARPFELLAIDKINHPIKHRAFLICGEAPAVEFDPSVSLFIAKEEKGKGEVIIPLPGYANAVSEFRGRVMCYSISPKSGIRLNSGSVHNSEEYVHSFDEIMHREAQKLLIEEHKRYFAELKRS